MTVTTSLQEEVVELRRWTPRHPQAGHLRAFEQLVINEFLSADEQSARQAAALAKLLSFAAVHVPYYRETFRKAALSPQEIRGPGDLPRLPILTKREVMDRTQELRAEWLPPGEGPPVPYKSTGTTGRAVQGVMSRSSSLMFGILWHRQARWFRYDPKGCFVKIRTPATIPRREDGSRVPNGSVLESPAWRYVGKFFVTGPEVTFGTSNPIEQQVAWLRRFRPDYLLSYPGGFEELGLACESSAPVDSLKSLLGISGSATPGLRAWIERTYGLPFHQNYGLNEIGIVAARCAAGRYHVHAEHCVVEIVDSQGRPVPPGESGHLLVTALRNLAMPLIRYDTGDIAVATEGACPCGRTLPSFREIVGRYRRYAGLPPGTRERTRALGEVFEKMPAELVRNLRRYQFYQTRDNRFEVRLRTAGPMPPEFGARIRECWQAVAGDPPVPLAIVEDAPIVDSPGGKFLDFDSEFYGADDRASLARPEGRAAASPDDRPRH